MNIELPLDRIAAFCERWSVKELALFGSVLRHDFGPESDVDVLVTFAPGTSHSLFDRVDMELELAELLGRKVDVVEKRAIRNPFRRHHIVQNHRVVYAT